MDGTNQKTTTQTEPFVGVDLAVGRDFSAVAAAQETELSCLVPLYVERLEAADGDKARRYRVQFVKVGRVKRADGKDAPWEISAEAIRNGVDRGLFDNLACFIDHPPASWVTDYRHSLRNLFGVSETESYWDEASQSAMGIVRCYDTEAGRLAAELFDQIIRDQAAGQATPNVGGSIVFYPERTEFIEGDGKRDRLKVTREFRKILSWDAVFGPGAEGSRSNAQSSKGCKFFPGNFPVLPDQREENLSVSLSIINMT